MLSQRDRATLRVIEHAKSLKITQVHWKLLRKACVSSYYYDTMSVCRIISQIFSVKEWLYLETGQGSFKVIENSAVR